MNKKTKGSSIAKLIGVTFLGIVLVLAMGACSGGTTSETPTPAPTSTPGAALTPTPEPTPTPTPTPRPTPIPLFLDVLSPEDGSVVATNEVEVTGKTLPTAIVSVNGSLVPVGADGGFTATVALEEGANYVDVVASDVKGNEEGTVLAVIYSP